MTDPAVDLGSPLDFEHPGEWIEAQCRALDVTPHTVAKQAKLSPSTVYRWVAKQTEPDTYSLRKVRSAFVSFWATREEKTG